MAHTNLETIREPSRLGIVLDGCALVAFERLEVNMLDKKIAHSKEFLLLMIDNFNRRARWQVEDNFACTFAKDALDLAMAGFRLDALLQLKYNLDKEKKDDTGTVG
jgi:hypothetical protein